ncbi:MAG: DUF4198 domain-containing protein [Planctomycetota bacterium]|nr:DUF4198 domain-containing protein [Planctomycetota bacterium]
MFHRTIASLLVCVLCVQAIAHDYWIVPSTFTPRLGEIVSLRTLVGDHYVGEPRPRDPTKLDRFVIAVPEGEVPVVGRDGEDPAGFIRIGASGTYAVGYLSKFTKVTLAGHKFEEYLKERGLSEVAQARAASGKADSDGNERFLRCAKALLCVDGKPGPGFDHVFGFPVELVPVSDPYLLKAGDSLKVKVLAAGKPMQGALVIAMNKSDPAKTLSLTCDAQGLVAVPLAAGGEWLLSVVKMAPVTDPAAGVDWESYWGSLTFQLSDSGQAPATTVPAVTSVPAAPEAPASPAR